MHGQADLGLEQQLPAQVESTHRHRLLKQWPVEVNTCGPHLLGVCYAGYEVIHAGNIA